MSTLSTWLVTMTGVIAATMTTGSWVPQAVRTIRTKSAGDFAWSYLLFFGTGVFLWLLYGVFRRDVALMGCNGVTFLLVARIGLVKWQVEREAKSAAAKVQPEPRRDAA
ncbi:MAG: hypothetical protein JST54_04530 [Deltaproteobacteria bacterium]|nr:hypothetical protein [Deltaproteobacteria bacterium]